MADRSQQGQQQQQTNKQKRQQQQQQQQTNKQKRPQDNAATPSETPENEKDTRANGSSHCINSKKPRTSGVVVTPAAKSFKTTAVPQQQQTAQKQLLSRTTLGDQASYSPGATARQTSSPTVTLDLNHPPAPATTNVDSETLKICLKQIEVQNQALWEVLKKQQQEQQEQQSLQLQQPQLQQQQQLQSQARAIQITGMNGNHQNDIGTTTVVTGNNPMNNVIGAPTPPTTPGTIHPINESNSSRNSLINPHKPGCAGGAFTSPGCPARKSKLNPKSQPSRGHPPVQTLAGPAIFPLTALSMPRPNHPKPVLPIGHGRLAQLGQTDGPNRP